MLGDNDYVSGPYTVTIPAGGTSAPFDITINDDNTLEDNETFTIDVDPSSLPTGVTVGSTGQATITIDNDDCKCVKWMLWYTFRCALNKYDCMHIKLKLLCGKTVGLTLFMLTNKMLKFYNVYYSLTWIVCHSLSAYAVRNLL